MKYYTQMLYNTYIRRARRTYNCVPINLNVNTYLSWIIGCEWNTCSPDKSLLSNGLCCFVFSNQTGSHVTWQRSRNKAKKEYILKMVLERGTLWFVDLCYNQCATETIYNKHIRNWCLEYQIIMYTAENHNAWQKREHYDKACMLS